MKQHRRAFIKQGAAVAALSVVGARNPAAGAGAPQNPGGSSAPGTPAKRVVWPIKEGPNTPKLCLPTGTNANEAQMKRIKQVGIDHVLMSGPRLPWKEDDLRAIMERFKAGGLNVINMMVGGFNNAILGREGRDAEIEAVKQSLVAAGAAGLPVVEYNFYVHRLTEGYHNVKGRGDSGYLAFDYDTVKDLPPDPRVGVHTADEMWDNLTYFLKAVIPVAEKAGVRMALHPNDPPPPISRGSAQIMASLAGWKRLITIVDSPSNGITFDCGVTCEIGEDPVEVARYFASRDRINHHHYRSANVEKPSEKYVEQFVDEGHVNMLAVMQELVRNGYNRGLFPEHPRGLDADRQLGGDFVGYIYNVAYARAMLQAVLSLA
jgi:mannonate dehydratase